MYVASSRMIDSPKYIEFFSIMKSQIASRMCKSNVTDHSLGPTSLDEARVIWCTPYSDYLLKRGQGERHKTVSTRKISTRSADDNEPGISNLTSPPFSKIVLNDIIWVLCKFFPFNHAKCIRDERKMLGFSQFSVPYYTPKKNSRGLVKKNPHKRQITMSEHIKGYIFKKNLMEINKRWNGDWKNLFTVITFFCSTGKKKDQKIIDHSKWIANFLLQITSD